VKLLVLQKLHVELYCSAGDASSKPEKKKTTKKGGGVGAMAVHRAPLLEHGAKSPPQVCSQKNNISRLSIMAHIRGLTTSAMPELPYPANLCNVEHWCNLIPHPSVFSKNRNL
jgi:hypothetical protein